MCESVGERGGSSDRAGRFSAKITQVNIDTIDAREEEDVRGAKSLLGGLSLGHSSSSGGREILDADVLNSERSHLDRKAGGTRRENADGVLADTDGSSRYERTKITLRRQKISD